ncbi:MAG: hypothetical protein WC755_00065 [Candidatus Woesearchaeota archaeon]|jgi:hypothetical protein
MEKTFYLETDMVFESGFLNFMLDMFHLDEYVYCRYIDGDHHPGQYFDEELMLEVDDFEFDGSRWKVKQIDTSPNVMVVYDTIKKEEKFTGANLGADVSGVGLVVTKYFVFEESIRDGPMDFRYNLILLDNCDVEKIKAKLKELKIAFTELPKYEPNSEWSGFEQILKFDLV